MSSSSIVIIGCLYHLEDVRAEGDGKTNGIVFPKVDVHHGFGNVDGDVTEWCPLLEFVDILKLAEVRVDSVHVNSNGGVDDECPAAACVTQRIIYPKVGVSFPIGLITCWTRDLNGTSYSISTVSEVTKGQRRLA